MSQKNASKKWYKIWYYRKDCYQNIQQCIMRNDLPALEEYVEFLRANPEEATRINERNDLFGRTILSYCAQDGCTEMLRLLLTIPGVDVTLVDKRYQHNALMWAAKCGQDECVDLLIPLTDLKYKDVLGRDAAKLAKTYKLKVRLNKCRRLQS